MNLKTFKILILFTWVMLAHSCSSKDFPPDIINKKKPENLQVQVSVGGITTNTPNGDGSGVVTFSISATNTTYYQVIIPADSKTLTLNTSTRGNISYTFTSNPGKTSVYPVQISAYNTIGHVDTTMYVSVYFAIPKTDILFWKTTSTGNALFARQYVGLNFNQATNTNKTISIDTTQVFQKIDGFGFALTGGSATLINGLSLNNKTNLLNELFTTDSTNIGLSYLRISIGASDLSAQPFSYDEVQGDSTLQNFSLNAEKKDLIPVLKQILQLNPSIKIIATPWSAPTWMKTNGSFYGGSLKIDCYNVYARYFAKYILAMQAEGIPIEAITPQNEPLNAYNNPSMLMLSDEQNNFIKNYLSPQFKANGISTKIIIYDHNLDHPEYATQILNDNTTYNIVDGSAFHLYAGDINTLSSVHSSFPNKNLYFTEQFTSSTGDFAADLQWHIQNLIIGATRNWSKNVIEWNLASDSGMGPHTNGGCTTCLGAITIDGESVIKRNVSYYIIAHAAKFVRPGAVRIGSLYYGDLPSVAFKNLDGKKVVIVLNNTNAAQTFNIQFNSKIVTSILEGGSVATYVW